MELGLSIGETPDKVARSTPSRLQIALAMPFSSTIGDPGGDAHGGCKSRRELVQLDLLPLSPDPSLRADVLSPSGIVKAPKHDHHRRRGGDTAAAIRNSHGDGRKRDWEAAGIEAETERASSRCSDEEEGGSSARKKLRLSKEQYAYLEESFREHSTLNPKQKIALAKQLNLRPRQVEVWFQNRRARTKLKQTEVDCEHLKRCCETLTEENRRLQREVEELRALKSLPVSGGCCIQVPATTLSICPSCERKHPAERNASSFKGFNRTRCFPFLQHTSAAT
ncbi:homeobox-leucine zipper protein HOX27-like [Nymphaea colorata]|nr:homeobox-leucine zipper protein HOX27-like [Nymphaea colorata]